MYWQKDSSSSTALSLRIAKESLKRTKTLKNLCSEGGRGGGGKLISC